MLTCLCAILAWIRRLRKQLPQELRRAVTRSWLAKFPSTACVFSPGVRPAALRRLQGREVLFRDFKDTVYPLFESDTLFLEGVVVLCLVV